MPASVQKAKQDSTVIVGPAKEAAISVRPEEISLAIKNSSQYIKNEIDDETLTCSSPERPMSQEVLPVDDQG